MKVLLNILNEIAEHDSVYNQLLLVVSDIEMPRMDGYTLTSEIRKSDQFNELRILLHSSLSGKFNESMVKNVGANGFVAKFAPNDFAAALLEMIK